MPVPAIGRWAAAVLLLGALAVGGCASASAPVPPGQVEVANFAFSPSTITVAVGQSVTWVFDQPDAPHNVHSTAGPTQIDSGTPQGKGKFIYTFQTAGTYKYMCQVHPNMRGTVVVTP
jgi:plastocyanin